MVIFPLAPDQTIAQMWSNGARGGTYWHRRHTQCLCPMQKKNPLSSINTAKQNDDNLGSTADTQHVTSVPIIRHTGNIAHMKMTASYC